MQKRITILKFSLILFFQLSINSFSQDTIFNPTIKSVQCFRSGNMLSYPIIKLNQAEKISLIFDDLSPAQKDFYYTIRHCDHLWQPTQIEPTEYIEGFEVNRIQTIQPSVLTILPYTHYHLQIPNDEIKIKISGNYLLQIFEDEEKQKPVLQTRFYVYENNADIEVTVKRPTLPDYIDNMQEIDVVVRLGKTTISDYKNESALVIMQNFRIDNSIILSPKYIKGNELVYNYETENLFYGGKEFRHFNVKNLKLLMENIAKIEYKAPYYHFYLNTDNDRTFKRYTFERDINGQYMIDADNRENPQTMADYVYVHFTLPNNIPVIDGSVHIFGALTGWQCNDQNKMNYDFETHTYTGTLLLKQGYYNYQYAVKDFASQKIDLTYFEGSSYETENNYTVLFYEFRQGTRYEKLTGIGSGNFLKKIGNN